MSRTLAPVLMLSVETAPRVAPDTFPMSARPLTVRLVVPPTVSVEVAAAATESRFCPMVRPPKETAPLPVRLMMVVAVLATAPDVLPMVTLPPMLRAVLPLTARVAVSAEAAPVDFSPITRLLKATAPLPVRLIVDVAVLATVPDVFPMVTLPPMFRTVVPLTFRVEVAAPATVEEFCDIIREPMETVPLPVRFIVELTAPAAETEPDRLVMFSCPATVMEPGPAQLNVEASPFEPAADLPDIVMLVIKAVTEWAPKFTIEVIRLLVADAELTMLKLPTPVPLVWPPRMSEPVVTLGSHCRMPLPRMPVVPTELPPTKRLSTLMKFCDDPRFRV